MALVFSLTLSFYGGEKLSLILKSAEELISNIVSVLLWYIYSITKIHVLKTLHLTIFHLFLQMKHSREGTKTALLNKLLIDELMGNSSGDFPDFGGVVHDECSLFFDAQTKQNTQLIEGIHIRHFNSAFWMGGESVTNIYHCSSRF